jgi:hypothetical protein
LTRRNLQDWARIAEIASAVAVIISLVYVGYGVRENTRALEASSREALGAQDLTYLATALDTSVVARAIDKIERRETLSALEHSQLRERQHLNFRIFENAHYQHQKGTLDDSEWERYTRIIRINICEYLPAQTMWDEYEAAFVPEFRLVVEEIRGSCKQ